MKQHFRKNFAVEAELDGVHAVDWKQIEMSWELYRNAAVEAFGGVGRYAE